MKLSKGYRYLTFGTPVSPDCKRVNQGEFYESIVVKIMLNYRSLIYQ